MPSSKRHAQFSEGQRQKVHQYFHTANASTGKKPSQSETILCAKNTLGIEISQPQASKWYSDRFKHLAAPQEKSLTTYTPTPSVESGLLSPVHGIVVSTVTEASLANQRTEAELVSLAERVASQRVIQNLSFINDFVTPTSEEVFDDINTSEELYLEEIAELFDSEILIENDEEDFEKLGSGVDLDEVIAVSKLLL
ncbi:hypothetical protein K3495_g2600 [Podosphaera aphanis]|nr:hypothetical protein K3495_g2600 [Podosphaera aphanis]